MTKTEIIKILARIKVISETHRNPDWQDNRRRMKAGKVCGRAAGPRDLGANHRDQSMTRKMREIATLGYLREISRYGFPFFALTDEGHKYLTENEKSAKKR